MNVTPTERDSDSISITSTVSSEQGSEYDVECILDEYAAGNEIRYLVKWTGYPIERCTWEPADSFSSHDTLREWRKKKRAIAEGKTPAFDTDAWEEKILSLQAEKEDRKHRRQAKRRRLGLPGADADTHRLTRPSGKTVKPLADAGREEVTAKKARQASLSQSTAKPNASRSDMSAPKPSSPRRQSLPHPVPPEPRIDGMKPSRPLPPPQVPVLFGNSKDPAHPVPNRAKRSLDLDSSKRFNLSTRWRYEKAKNDEPPPDVSRLEIFRPSEFPRQSGVNSAELSIRGCSRRSDALVNESPTTNAIGNTTIRDAKRPDESSPTTAPANHSSQNISLPLSASHNKAPVPSREDMHRDTVPNLPQRRPGPQAFQLRRAPEIFWNPGEILVDIYYGPDREEIGPARLCGLDKRTGDTLKSCKSNHRIKLWFRHLHPSVDCQKLCREIKDDLVCSGWVEGLNHTEIGIYHMGKDLMNKNTVAVILPDNPLHEEFIAYSPKSQDFTLLGHNSRELGEFFVRLAVIRPERLTRKLDNYLELFKSPITTQKPALPTRSSNVVIRRESIQELAEKQSNNSALKDTYSQAVAKAPHPNGQGVLESRITGQKAALPARSSNNAIRREPNQEPAEKQSNNPAIQGTNSQAVAMAPPPNGQGVPEQLHTSAMSPPQNNSPVAGEPMNVDVDNARLSTVPSNNDNESSGHGVSSTTDFLNNVFLDQFGVTFSMLAAIDVAEKSTSAECFYIVYPQEVKVFEECTVLETFLRGNKAMIYTSRIKEDWERFVRINNGVILLHESFMDRYSEPWFRELTRKSSWSFSLSTPSGGAFFHRLFPTGGVVLITEDFMVHCPEATIIMLQWLQEYFSKRFPGSWKVMFRPDVLNWLRTVYSVNEKLKGSWLSMYQLILMLHKSNDGELPDGSSNAFCESAVISPPDIPFYGSKSEEDHPFTPKDLTPDHRKADHLIEFFAGWALVNCYRFKRFYVFTNVPQLPRWRSWYHLDAIFWGEKEVLKYFKVDHALYWNKIYKSSHSGEPKSQTTTPFTPRTPKVPSNQAHLGSTDKRHSTPGRDYPQPYK